MAWAVKVRTYCSHCQKRYRQYDKVLERGITWCSQKCGQAVTGEQHPPRANARGYIEVWSEREGKYVLEHREVWRASRGWPTTEGPWSIHHKDRNRCNNALENLEWYPDALTHIRAEH